MPLQLIREVEFRVEFTPEQEQILKAFGKKVALTDMISTNFPGVKLLITYFDGGLLTGLCLPDSLDEPQFLQEIVSAMENWFALQ